MKEGGLTKSKGLIFACAAFIAGIAAAPFFPESWDDKNFWWFSLALAGGLLLIIIEIWKKPISNSESGRAAFAGLFFLWLAFFSLGVWRYGFSRPKDYPDRIWHYNGETVTILGRVFDEADVRENNTKLKIETEFILLNSVNSLGSGPRGSNVTAAGTDVIKKMPVRGLVLATVNSYPSYDYGDRLELKCNLKKPEPIEDFNYDRYLARYNIHAVCYYPKVKLLSPAGFKIFSFGWWYGKTLAIREAIKEISGRGIGEPEASIAQAITFGIRRTLPAEVNQTFSQTGLSHITAVSGMNITLVSVIAMNFFIAVGIARRRATWAASALIIFYVVLVAFPASAVRAGLMGIILIWAMNLGRLSKITNLIVLAASLMLLFNPRILRDDLGFQLSFMATLSLVYFYPIFKSGAQKLKFYPKAPKIISETLLVTLAAQVLTVPILVYNFHFVSVIAPLANLLVLWAILPIMAFTFFGLIFSIIFSGWAFLIFLPAWGLSKYLILISRSLAGLPFSQVNLGYVSWIIILIYYLILAIFLFKRKNKGFSIDFS